MNKTQVGELFQTGRTKYLDGIHFNYDKLGMSLIIMTSDISEKELELAKNGKINFRLYESQPVIFFMFKIPGFMNPSDGPYSYFLLPEENKPELLEIEDGKGFGLTIFLIEATTGITKVIRYIGLSTDFSKNFLKMLQRQRDFGFIEGDYDKALSRIYKQFSPEQLWRQGSIKFKIERSR